MSSQKANANSLQLHISPSVLPALRPPEDFLHPRETRIAPGPEEPTGCRGRNGDQHPEHSTSLFLCPSLRRFVVRLPFSRVSSVSSVYLVSPCGAENANEDQRAEVKGEAVKKATFNAHHEKKRKKERKKEKRRKKNNEGSRQQTWARWDTYSTPKHKRTNVHRGRDKHQTRTHAHTAEPCHLFCKERRRPGQMHGMQLQGLFWVNDVSPFFCFLFLDLFSTSSPLCPPLPLFTIFPFLFFSFPLPSRFVHYQVLRRCKPGGLAKPNAEHGALGST